MLRLMVKLTYYYKYTSWYTYIQYVFNIIIFCYIETCVVCTENKPVLPMTPYSKRRSKTPSRHSLKNRNKSIDTFDEDLISWDTPDKKHRKY